MSLNHKMGQKRRRNSILEVANDSGRPAEGEVATPATKKAKVEDKKTLFVRSLPPGATTESLTDWFSQHYPVKHATVVLDSATKASRGYGFVTLTDPEDAAEAKEKLNNSVFKGRRLKLDFAESRHRDGDGGATAGQAALAAKKEKLKRQAELEETRKPLKLIVRNLPWSIKYSDQLAALFQGFGKVKYADVPNNKGKLAGFGFVTMQGKKHADRAIEEMNGQIVDGRTLAVDWAVDKATWEQQNSPGNPRKTVQVGTNDASKQHISGQPSKPATDFPLKGGEEKESDDEDADVRNFMEAHMDDLEDEESVDSDGTDGAEDEGPADDADKPNKGPSPKSPATDNSTTVFIRNLPFTSTEAGLKSHFEQFGPVRYARCVMDRATDRPAGTGFVCFYNLEDCKMCLRSAPRQQQGNASVKHSVLQNEDVDRDGRYTLEGRVLQVSQAVTKDEAIRLATIGPGAKGRNERDKRRLFLLAEGTIASNSPMAAMLAPSELKLREMSAKQRKKLVEGNPSLYISLTRIALRNIPRNLDSKALKALGREAIVEFAKDVSAKRRQPLSREELMRGGEEDEEAERRRKEKGKGVVKQAKIIFESRDGSKVAEQQVGSAGSKSRGYGFIEYSSHRWALMGLRWLNGHALKNEAGKTQRLIAEFAIENAQVVLRRKTAQEKARARAREDPEEVAEAQNISKGADLHKSFGSATLKKGKGSKSSIDASDGRAAVAKAVASRANKPSKDAGSKLTQRQQIIGRKRMMRKRKRSSKG
jgi:nucleolar protein 4